MKRQARGDAGGMMSALILAAGRDELSEVTHIDEPWKKYWDDMSGKELKPDLDRAAREEELKVVDEMGVWRSGQSPNALMSLARSPSKSDGLTSARGTTSRPMLDVASSPKTSTSTSGWTSLLPHPRRST